jgi:hypothetical protein
MQEAVALGYLTPRFTSKNNGKSCLDIAGANTSDKSGNLSIQKH